MVVCTTVRLNRTFRLRCSREDRWEGGAIDRITTGDRRPTTGAVFEMPPLTVQHDEPSRSHRPVQKSSQVTSGMLSRFKVVNAGGRSEIIKRSPQAERLAAETQCEVNGPTGQVGRGGRRISGGFRHEPRRQCLIGVGSCVEFSLEFERSPRIEDVEPPLRTQSFNNRIQLLQCPRSKPDAIACMLPAGLSVCLYTRDSWMIDQHQGLINIVGHRGKYRRFNHGWKSPDWADLGAPVDVKMLGLDREMVLPELRHLRDASVRRW